jgi:9-cis-epoxycarotenoid dioxygenase
LKNENNHIFDGDGMIHCIEFKEDKIIYHNRWIRTYRYKTEKRYKKPLFVRLGKLNSIEIFTNFIKRLTLFEDIRSVNGEGTANTNVICHNNKILALNEMDKPYLIEIKNGKVETIGRFDFEGKLKHNMCAHPKIDPDTREMVISGYDILLKQFYITLINKNSEIIKTKTIDLNNPRLIHDVGITKNKIIILDLPLEFSLTNVLMSKFPIDINKDANSRIGLLDRNDDIIRWYELDDNEIIFHIANSWEQTAGRYIIIYAFCYDINEFNIKELDTQRPKLKRVVIDTKRNKTKIKTVSDNYGELPIIDESLIGKKTDFIYYSRISDEGFDAIVRHNIKTKNEDIIKFGKGLYGGECAIYDNYIINILYNVETNRSELVVYDKKTFELLNNIDLKCRIPFGFHGRIIDK